MIDIAKDEELLRASIMNDEPYTPRYFKVENGYSSDVEITSMKEVEGFV
ncbi:hypothetical protein [Clostridium sp. HBUAS56010]|nr:hypothetical protein [Clostridium sp. HBUAS56010]